MVNLQLDYKLFWSQYGWDKEGQLKDEEKMAKEEEDTVGEEEEEDYSSVEEEEARGKMEKLRRRSACQAGEGEENSRDKPVEGVEEGEVPREEGEMDREAMRGRKMKKRLEERLWGRYVCAGTVPRPGGR